MEGMRERERLHRFVYFARRTGGGLALFARLLQPFAPLQLNDPPGRITQFKLRRLDPGQCVELLQQANQQQLISSTSVADTQGDCPLNNVVRVRDFGPVKLSSSFLASCPLALSSALLLNNRPGR
jgi:hypothetical protein